MLMTTLLPAPCPHCQSRRGIAEFDDSGETYTLNGDEPMPTASLIKFPLMLEVYMQVMEGKLKLTDRAWVGIEPLLPASGRGGGRSPAGVRPLAGADPPINESSH